MHCCAHIACDCLWLNVRALAAGVGPATVNTPGVGGIVIFHYLGNHHSSLQLSDCACNVCAVSSVGDLAIETAMVTVLTVMKTFAICASLLLYSILYSIACLLLLSIALNGYLFMLMFHVCLCRLQPWLHIQLPGLHHTTTVLVHMHREMNTLQQNLLPQFLGEQLLMACCSTHGAFTAAQGTVHCWTEMAMIGSMQCDLVVDVPPGVDDYHLGLVMTESSELCYAMPHQFTSVKCPDIWSDLFWLACCQNCCCHWNQ